MDYVRTVGDWSERTSVDRLVEMTDLTVLGRAALYEMAVRLANQQGLACFETCTRVHCPHPCPPVIIPLLVYCYAAGVYGSEEIEELSYKEEYVQRLSGDKSILPSQVRCFRREHRRLLQRSLAELIREVRARAGAMPESSEPAEGASTELNPEAWHCEWEAEERIRLAILFDSMELDG